MGAKMETAVGECYNVDNGTVEGRARKPKPQGGKKPKPSEGGEKPNKKPGQGGEKPNKKPGQGGKKPGTGGKKPGQGGKKPGQGGKECPEFDDLVSEIRSKFADDVCFLEKMEWVQNEEWNEVAFKLDMSSLNFELTGKINQTAIEECAVKMKNKLTMMGEKCSDEYTDEQKETLMQVGHYVAYGICGHKGFEKACGEYAKEGFEAYMMSYNQMTVGK